MFMMISRELTSKPLLLYLPPKATLLFNGEAAGSFPVCSSLISGKIDHISVTLFETPALC